MMSCQVSLKPNNGPEAPQRTNAAKAMVNAAGRPTAREAHLANRVKTEGCLVTLIRIYEGNIGESELQARLRVFLDMMDWRRTWSPPLIWSSATKKAATEKFFTHAVRAPYDPILMKRKGSAVWRGGLKNGEGTVSTESGVLSVVGYSFAKRFGEEPGTNPEELIGAAHAGCFSMALSGQLGAAGFEAEKIETTATVTVENVEGGFAITKVHLDVQASVPNLDESKFQEIAKKAKEGCPVSKLLKADITMDAKLA
jgi:lipoyl-dependent peroxiredoxin